MERINTIVVALDRSALDDRMIKHVFTMAPLLKVNQVIFAHINPSKEKATGTIQKEIEQAVYPYLAGLEWLPELFYEIREGEPVAKLLEISKQYQSDLLVVGRKKLGEGDGTFSKRISKKASCSVLTLTERKLEKVQRMLIPVDMSAFSRKALESGLEMADKMGCEVTCVYSFGLPVGYHTSGKTPEQYGDVLRQHAEKRFKHFLKDINPRRKEVGCRFLFDPVGGQSAKMVYNLALVEDFDMIVMGSGRPASVTQAVMKMSDTQKLMRENLSIPMMVVKDKNKSFGFISGLMAL